VANNFNAETQPLVCNCYHLGMISTQARLSGMPATVENILSSRSMGYLGASRISPPKSGQDGRPVGRISATTLRRTTAWPD
jgi:hypothetical protein